MIVVAIIVSCFLGVLLGYALGVDPPPPRRTSRAATDAAFRRGREDGMYAMLRTLGPHMLRAERVESLIRLCHPDRHGNSREATEVTQWLLSERQRLRGER